MAPKKRKASISSSDAPDSGSASIIDTYYSQLAAGEGRAIRSLESSGYLETTLWPSFDAHNNGVECVMAVIMMINQKCRQGLNGFTSLLKSESDNEKFAILFHKLASAFSSSIGSKNIEVLQRDANGHCCDVRVVIFLINCFRYMDQPIIADMLLLYFSSSSDNNKPANSNHTPSASKSAKKGKSSAKEKIDHNELLASIIHETGETLLTLLPTSIHHDNGGNIQESHDQGEGKMDVDEQRDVTPLVYVDHVLEFLADLLSITKTRPFTMNMIKQYHLMYKLSTIGLKPTSSTANMYHRVLEMLSFHLDVQTGRVLPESEISNIRQQTLYSLQKEAFKYDKDALQDIVYSSIGQLSNTSFLKQSLSVLTEKQLQELALRLKVVESDEQGGEPEVFQFIDALCSAARDGKGEYGQGREDYRRSLLIELIIQTYVPSTGCKDGYTVSDLSLYPDEKLLYNSFGIPDTGRNQGVHGAGGNTALALPKLNLQYLTLLDYLFRQFSLYRLESAYAIREDIHVAVKSMKHKLANLAKDNSNHMSGDKGARFTGWSSQATPILNLSIKEVGT